MAKTEKNLYLTEHIIACEQQAMVAYQTDEQQLMLKAGTEAFFFMQRLFPRIRTIAVFFGAGNNAGDCYVLARLAHEHGV